MTKKNDRKLALAKTTLRPLSAIDLNAARGGFIKPEDDPARNSTDPVCP